MCGGHLSYSQLSDYDSQILRANLCDKRPCVMVDMTFLAQFHTEYTDWRNIFAAQNRCLAGKLLQVLTPVEDM